jgi:hypothetical protein
MGTTKLITLGNTSIETSVQTVLFPIACSELIPVSLPDPSLLLQPAAARHHLLLAVPQREGLNLDI